MNLTRIFWHIFSFVVFQPSTSTTSFVRVGLPTLTVNDEKRIVEMLVERDDLSLNEAQSIACKKVMEIIRENSHVEMNCVQLDWFYGEKRKQSRFVCIQVKTYSLYTVIWVDPEWN